MDEFKISQLSEYPGDYIFRPLEKLVIDEIELRNNEFYDILSATRNEVLIAFSDLSSGCKEQVRLTVPAAIAYDERRVYIQPHTEFMVEDMLSPDLGNYSDPHGHEVLYQPKEDPDLPDVIDEVYLD